MITWFEQERPASCVAACLRMILSAYAQSYSEQEIRQLLGNPRFGLTLGKAGDRLIEAGAIAETHADWGLDDLRDSLRAGNYPMVGIERRFFGYPDASHAVVLVSLLSTEVRVLDPLSDPDPQPLQLFTFEAAWKSAGQEVLVLLSPLP